MELPSPTILARGDISLVSGSRTALGWVWGESLPPGLCATRTGDRSRVVTVSPSCRPSGVTGDTCLHAQLSLYP